MIKLYTLAIIWLVVACGATALQFSLPGSPVLGIPPRDARHNQQLAKEIENSVNFCQGCRELVSFSANFNSSQHREEYKDAFNNFCEFYYPTSEDFRRGPCPFFVRGLFYVLDHMDPIHHCDQIGACGPTKQEEAVKKATNNEIMTPKASNSICEFCEQIVQQSKDYLLDPKNIDQVMQQADALCEFLKAFDLDRDCRRLVDKNLDQLFSFVRQIKPSAYCAALQACPASKRHSKALEASSLPTLADFNNFGIETSVSIGDSSGPQANDINSLSHSAGPNCMICKTIVKEMFHFLRENRTEANIVMGLEKVCGLIYGSKGSSYEQCDSMVKAYTRELVQLLIDETNPEMICMILEQCVYDKALQFMKTTSLKSTDWNIGNLITALDSSIGPNSMAACVECKFFIKYLRNLLQEPESQKQVQEWLIENLCNSLQDKDLVDQCTEMVTKYSTVFLQSVAGTLNPKEACSELGVCHKRKFNEVYIVDNKKAISKRPTSVLLDSVQQELKPVANQYCEQCVTIITQIDEYLSTHSIDKDVSVLIDQVCNKMPEGSLRNECAFLVKNFGSEIAQAISTMDNPRQFCGKIMIC